MSDTTVTSAGPPTDLSRTGLIVVNYGSHELLELNLRGVSDQAPEAAIVVVDNFTSDGERERVRNLCVGRGWTPVLLPRNQGFGEGVNAGAAAALAAGATTLLVLNPDASIRRPSLERLVGAVHRDPSLMVAPLIRRSDGTVWFSGSDLDLAAGRMRSPRMRLSPSPGAYREWLTGACFAVSAELWREIGGFDDDYFLYWEDVDLSYRVVEAGGSIRVDPDSEAVHDAGGTHTEAVRGRAKSELYYYYNIRNRLVYAAKNLDDRQLADWLRATYRVSYEILLRGGRKQFLRPLIPFRAFVLGIRDGRRYVARSRRTRAAVRRSRTAGGALP